MEQNDGIDEDLVGPESKSIPPAPPLINDNDDKGPKAEGEPGRDVAGLEEPQADAKKKKSGSKKKSKKGKSPKTGRKQLADEWNSMLDNGEKTVTSKKKKRSSMGAAHTNTKSKNRKGRRQSTGSSEIYLNSDGTADNEKQGESNASGATTDPQANKIVHEGAKDSNKQSSMRSFDSASTKKIQNRPLSNRSFDNSVQSSQKLPTSSRSFDSVETPKSLDKRFDGNSEIKKENSNGIDNSSDVEDETMCSFDNMNLVVNDGTRVLAPPSDDEQSEQEIQQQLADEKKRNADMDQKPKKKKQPLLTQTDELGRGSNHYKLEGVYYFQKKESSPQKSTKKAKPIEDTKVAIKPVVKSNAKEKRSKTPIKGHNSREARSKTPIKGFRSRRRKSLGDDGIASPRSRSRELTSPRSRSKELTSPRSRSRELTSPRNKTPKDFTRSQDPLSSRSSHIKRPDKQVKRGSSAGIISKESKEAVNKLFAMDGAISRDDTIVANDATLDIPSLSTKDEITTPVTEIEKTLAENEEAPPPNDEKEIIDNDKESKPQTKTSEKKQRRRRSMSKSIRKDRPVSQNEDAGVATTDSCMQVTQENSTFEAGADQEVTDEQESDALENQMKCMDEVEKNNEDTMEVSQETKPPSNNVEKKQRKKSSMGKTMSRSSKQLNAEQELTELGIVLPEDDLIVTINAEVETDVKIETVESSSPRPSTPENTEATNENGIPATPILNDSEMTAEGTEKKRHRRSSMGKVSKKDKSNKGSKIAKKSSREKKSKSKDSPSDAMDLPISPAVENCVTVENRETKDSAKNQSSTSKIAKKDKTNRRSSVKEKKKKREKESVSAEAIPQIDASPTGYLVTKLKPDINAELSIPSSSNRSLHDFLSSHHSKRETRSICTDENSFYSESTASDETEEKESDSVVDDNYLQLTFSTEHGRDDNALFAMMDEKFHQSFQSLGIRKESDRNVSHKSFFSFTDEIDLKVSTTSYSLSNSGHVAKNKDDFTSDDDFLEDDDSFANATLEETAIQNNKFSTPVSRKKKLPPFGLSQSLHNPALHKSSSFANGTELRPKKNMRGMLQKMKMGSQRTLQKAASTRNMLGHATTKMLSRNKEEGKGLLRNASWEDDDND